MEETMTNITGNLVKNSGLALLASAATMSLSGCATFPIVDTHCTPPFNPNKPVSCPSSSLQALDTPMSALSLSNSFDASKFEADMTGSTVGIPSSGLYSITLNDQNGQPISQSSFGWTRNGNVISINNPAAVKNWMSSITGTVKSVKTNFVSLPVISQPGINSYMITIKYDQSVLGSAGSVWTEPGCNNGPFPGLYNCL
jgi:hypothetical protein